MGFFLYTVHIIVSLFLVLVVLLQQGKGADLSVFGGGGTMTAFGARGAATILHKMTVIGFILFIITTLSIGIYQSNKGQSSVMVGVESEESTAVAADEATPEEPELTGALPADEPAGEAAATPVDELAPEEEADEGGTDTDPEGATPEDADAGGADAIGESAGQSGSS